MKKVLVRGRAKGVVLKSNDPINFLGTVDKKTGIITDKNHDIYAKPVGGTMLVFPSGVGGSVGAYTINSIKSNGSAPVAMICTKPDLTVATGCALADIPLLIIPEEEFISIKTGQHISLDTDSEKPIIIQ